MKKVKIDYDANAKVKVRITYEDNHCQIHDSYVFYDLKCEQLSKELLHIIKNDYDVEVTKN